jgi:uncharacterized protein
MRKKGPGRLFKRNQLEWNESQELNNFTGSFFQIIDLQKNKKRRIKLGKIKANILFKTENGNRYLFDSKHKTTTLCHPLFYYLVQLDEQGVDLASWINQKTDFATISIDNIGTYAREDILYYYNKYLLLKKNGYFSEIDNDQKLYSQVAVGEIENALANVENVIFEVTESCNLNCMYCCFGRFYVQNPEKPRVVTPNSATAIQLLNYLKSQWESQQNHFNNKIIWIGFYGGEPLLNFEFIREVVNEANQLNLSRNNRFAFRMTSNGVLLTKYMDYLVQHDFFLTISLDGTEKNNEYRLTNSGESTHELIMENLYMLKEKYPEYFKNNISFNTVIHNKNTVTDVYRFFQMHFDKIPIFSTISRTGIDESQRERFMETFRGFIQSISGSEVYDEIEKKEFARLPNIQDLTAFIFNQNHSVFTDYSQLLVKDNQRKRFPTGTCIPFQGKFFLTARGNIMTCESIDHRFVLGTATPERVTIDPTEVASRYTAWFEFIRQKCLTCYFVDHCKMCIFTNDLSKETPECEEYYTREDMGDYIAKKIEYLEKKPWLYNKILKGGTHV